MKFISAIAFAASAVYCADSAAAPTVMNVTNTTVVNATAVGANATANATVPKGTADGQRTTNFAGMALAAGAFVASSLL